MLDAPILAIFFLVVVANVEMSVYRAVSTFLDFVHFLKMRKTSVYRDVSTFLDFGHFL